MAMAGSRPRFGCMQAGNILDWLKAEGGLDDDACDMGKV